MANVFNLINGTVFIFFIFLIAFLVIVVVKYIFNEKVLKIFSPKEIWKQMKKRLRGGFKTFNVRPIKYGNKDSTTPNIYSRKHNHEKTIT